MIQDGICNVETNNAECYYDGGDCCEYDCTGPNCQCYHEKICEIGKNLNNLYHPLVGDGFCNEETNTAICNFDGGDCCGDCVNKDRCTNSSR